MGYIVNLQTMRTVAIVFLLAQFMKFCFAIKTKQPLVPPAPQNWGGTTQPTQVGQPPLQLGMALGPDAPRDFAA